jgi:predicted secreted hydrolase
MDTFTLIVPSYELQGKINAEEVQVRVTGSSWADPVFESTQLGHVRKKR